MKLFTLLLLTISLNSHSQTSIEYYNRGNSKANSNDYRGAIANYTKAIELNSQNAEAFYNRGIVKDNIEDYQGALVDYIVWIHTIYIKK